MGDDLMLSILLQLGYLDAASRSGTYSCSSTGCPIRLIQVVPSSDDAETNSERCQILSRWLHHSRIPGSSCELVDAPANMPHLFVGDWAWMANDECVSAVQQTMQRHSATAASVHMLLPP